MSIYSLFSHLILLNKIINFIARINEKYDMVISFKQNIKEVVSI